MPNDKHWRAHIVKKSSRSYMLMCLNFVNKLSTCFLWMFAKISIKRKMPQIWRKHIICYHVHLKWSLYITILNPMQALWQRSTNYFINVFNMVCNCLFFREFLPATAHLGRTDVPKALALLLGSTYRWVEKFRIRPEAIGDTNGRESISLAWRRKSPFVERVDGTAEII